jgi:hypothetical protein
MSLFELSIALGPADEGGGNIFGGQRVSGTVPAGKVGHVHACHPHCDDAGVTLQCHDLACGRIPDGVFVCHSLDPGNNPTQIRTLLG